MIYSHLPSSSVLSIQIAVNFLQVFFLSLHSVAELLRKTGNTCDIPVLKMDFLQFIICVHMKTGVIDSIRNCTKPSVNTKRGHHTFGCLNKMGGGCKRISILKVFVLYVLIL